MLTAVVITREDTPVRYVASRDEVTGIRDAWERLEAVVPLRGRRFLGVVWPSGVYWAAVERLADREDGGLDEGVIPGGAYLRMRLRGEPPEVYDRIPSAFEVLAAGAERDPERPDIEFYRRRDEIDILLPVR
jgi:hypothetical protein